MDAPKSNPGLALLDTWREVMRRRLWLDLSIEVGRRVRGQRAQLPAKASREDVEAAERALLEQLLGWYPDRLHHFGAGMMPPAEDLGIVAGSAPGTEPWKRCTAAWEFADQLGDRLGGLAAEIPELNVVADACQEWRSLQQARQTRRRFAEDLEAREQAATAFDAEVATDTNRRDPGVFLAEFEGYRMPKSQALKAGSTAVMEWTSVLHAAATRLIAQLDSPAAEAAGTALPKLTVREALEVPLGCIEAMEVLQALVLHHPEGASYTARVDLQREVRAVAAVASGTMREPESVAAEDLCIVRDLQRHVADKLDAAEGRDGERRKFRSPAEWAVHFVAEACGVDVKTVRRRIKRQT